MHCLPTCWNKRGPRVLIKLSQAPFIPTAWADKALALSAARQQLLTSPSASIPQQMKGVKGTLAEAAEAPRVRFYTTQSFNVESSKPTGYMDRGLRRLFTPTRCFFFTPLA
jgi:hypothetical protein